MDRIAECGGAERLPNGRGPGSTVSHGAVFDITVPFLGTLRRYHSAIMSEEKS